MMLIFWWAKIVYFNRHFWACTNIWSVCVCTKYTNTEWDCDRHQKTHRQQQNQIVNTARECEWEHPLSIQVQVPKIKNIHFNRLCACACKHSFFIWLRGSGNNNGKTNFLHLVSRLYMGVCLCVCVDAQYHLVYLHNSIWMTLVFIEYMNDT